MDVWGAGLILKLLHLILGLGEAGIKDVHVHFRDPGDVDQAISAGWEIEFVDHVRRGVVYVHKFDSPDPGAKLWAKAMREIALWSIVELHPASKEIAEVLLRYRDSFGLDYPYLAYRSLSGEFSRDDTESLSTTRSL